MKHIMLDLETMGVGPNSAIIAIGAVEFELDYELGVVEKGEESLVKGSVGNSFYSVIDLDSCIKSGLTMDASTVLWWMQQSDDARKQFDRLGDQLAKALQDFSNWFKEVNSQYVWGNGAAFDNVLLANAYVKCGLDQPWKHWDDRCYRTVKGLYPNIKMQRSGTHHNAVDDARSQAEHLITMLSK
jgi:exodeoxyribonuclease VIII